MGHSQGGLISRWAAQYFQSNTPIVLSGVISVDTPHEGANFAINGPALVTAVLAGEGLSMYISHGCVTPLDDWGCFFASTVIGGGIAFDGTLTAIQPSLGDLQPGSNFLNPLNSYPELFNSAAVIGYTPQRWAVARVMTEWIDGALWAASSGKTGPEPCNPEDACGERTVASVTDGFYDAVLVAAIVDAIVGFFDPGAWALEPYLVGTLFWMDVIDDSYNLLIDFPGDGSSDGMVQGPSQHYPSPAAYQYPINGADSHSAALRSTYDHPVLDTILANQFHVPTQASCTFGTSPSSLWNSALAASGTFNLVTAGGCQWSAFSNAPWLSISSGINGISGGAIGYSVLANPSTVPRQGTIQLGNGLSNTTIGVLQAGICTYTFGPGSEIASPPAGETASIAVNTQINCPWTVTTTTSWLSITSNSSGLGSGSFALVAASNITSADREGSVSLMGQTLGATLNVIDGSPVGTPGVGTVTINGSEITGTSNQCAIPPNHGSCPVTWRATGTVSVTVGGTAFIASYPSQSGTPTSASLAALIAAQINQPLSFLTASVATSGGSSTITIESSVNGADTNYPMAVSYNFNQYCNLFGGQKPPCVFTYPAFVILTTGSQMAGGTN